MDLIQINNENVLIMWGAEIIEKEETTRYLPIPELKNGVGIFRMALEKEEEDYAFPNDFYAMVSDETAAWEVEIPLALATMHGYPEGVSRGLSFIGA